MKQRPIPDRIWSAMGLLGGSFVIYHSHETQEMGIIAYADEISRAIDSGGRGGRARISRTAEDRISCSSPPARRGRSASREERRRRKGRPVLSSTRRFARCDGESPDSRRRSGESICRRRIRSSLPASGPSALRSTTRESRGSRSRPSSGRRESRSSAAVGRASRRPTRTTRILGAAVSDFAIPALPPGPHELELADRREGRWPEDRQEADRGPGALIPSGSETMARSRMFQTESTG